MTAAVARRSRAKLAPATLPATPCVTCAAVRELTCNTVPFCRWCRDGEPPRLPTTEPRR